MVILCGMFHPRPGIKHAYVCMGLRACVFECVRVYVGTCVRACMRVDACTCVCLSVRVCTLVQLCVNVWVLMNCCVCVFACSILGYSFSGRDILQ